MSEAQLSYEKCSMCYDQIGTLFCHDCEKILCMQCRTFHDRIPLTKGHVVIDSHSEGRGIFKPKPVCTTHKTEFFSVCLDCDCLICNECILSIHNGHKLGKIKDASETSREITRNIIEDLKSKVNVTSDMLKEIRTAQIPKLQLDCENFIGMISTTSNEFQQIINHTTKISKTKTSDFCQSENEPILEFSAHLECLQDSYTKTCTQFENILQEKHDVTFLSTKKSLQKDLDNLEEIPEMIKPKTLDAFQLEDFVNSVIEEIQQKFTIGILIEKKNQVDELTTELMKQKSKSKDLEMEKNKLQKRLDERELDIEQLLTENRKAMQTLKQELKDEKAKPCGLDERKLENREDREEIQGRKKYLDFTKWQNASRHIPFRIDESLTKLPNPIEENSIINSKGKQREHIVKKDNGKDISQNVR
ncbi:paramyosin-like [Mytilus edulis]|uniref:paramyosin-like n=1 Tax=Mytilus edulis TaxID=6550 RepID=UPI0039EE8446